MYDYILDALINIEAYLDNERSYSVEIPNHLFKTDILLDYYYYPMHFVDVDDDEKEMIVLTLAAAGYTDHYDALAELLWKANIEPIPKAELIDDNSYCFIMISFGTEPFQTYLKTKKARYEQVTFFCTPYTDRQGYQRFKILVVPNKFGSIFEEMKYARILEIGSEDAIDKRYWTLLNSAVEQICNEFSIEFESRSECTPNEKLRTLDNYSLYLKQFCHLVQIEDIEGFKNRWLEIQQQQKQLIHQLKEEMAYLTVTPALLHYRFLLSEFLTSTYDDHWQMDYDALSNYLSRYLERPFELDANEGLQPNEICQKLEAESDYSLLHIETGLENYCLLLCLKKDVDSFIHLADILDFPIRKLSD